MEHSANLAQSQLQELAVPDLYRRNAFRVLELPVATTMREVRRHQKRMKRRGKLGMAADNNGGYFPLNPKPDQDDLHMAMQRLQDPVCRFLDEFFWFWPREPGAMTDDVLTLLANKRPESARKLWIKYAGQDSLGSVSAHNLAVLYHLWALDLEYRAATEKLSEQEQRTRLASWRKAFHHWQALVGDESFWRRLKNRIREFNEPQLRPQLAEAVQLSLEKLILLINARLAVRAAQEGQEKVAQRHVQIMRESEIERDIVTAALRDAVSPIRERIKMICEPTESKADDNPAEGHRIAIALLKDTRPLLATIDLVLPITDALRHGAHDDVATNALKCQIVYGNETDDWENSVKLLDFILPIAESESVADRIRDNLQTVRNNLVVGRCNFCEQNQSDASAAVVVRMYGNVRRQFAGVAPFGAAQYRVTWQKAELELPRCKECKSKSLKTWTVCCCLAAVAIGLLAFAGGPCLGFVIVACLGTVGVFVGQVCAKNAVEYRLQPDSEKRKHARVKELLDQGWRFGDAPSPFEQQNAPM